MKITCPMCQAVLEIKKDDVLGKYYVCPNCDWAFQWKRHIRLANKPQNHSKGSLKPKNAPKHRRHQGGVTT